MNQQELAERRAFDFRVLNDMRCATFDFEAFQTMDDLQRHRRIITNPADGARASKYRWTFHVRTHISRDQFAPVTEIGVNSDITDYPRNPPATWILSSHVPWSPHFMRNAPVCIGEELWSPTGGHITLGELAINIAHLLNWDEKGRGSGYVGWNGAAIEHHKKSYGGRPIDPRLRYPVLPSWLMGRTEAGPSFQIMGRNALQDPGFRVVR